MPGSGFLRCFAGVLVYFIEAQLLVLEESVSRSTAPTGFSGLGERGTLWSIRRVKPIVGISERENLGFR